MDEKLAESRLEAHWDKEMQINRKVCDFRDRVERTGGARCECVECIVG
jgi:hypothetical protein